MAFTSSGGSKELSISISANDEGASEAFTDVSNSAIDMRTAVAGAGAVLAGAGVAGLAAATKAAADFEESMVEVEKVTNPETAEQMSSAIREMAETIPMAQKELAMIAADAGRFGIEGAKNIENFTHAVAKMSTATDLSAQESGESLAKLAELTNTPISEVENLGSAINHISNNFATSSSEIVDSMLRASGSLSNLGLNQTEIVGLSGALNEVSESSERAGTRLRRVAQEMMNPKKIGDISSALGMTVEEFKAMRNRDPTGLIRQMAQSMADGGEKADALRSALSTTSRQALTAMSQNLDGVDKALGEANTSYDKGTSLQKEFDAATNTFNARLQTLKNRFTNIGITIGNYILPYINKTLDVLIPLIDRFAKVNKQMDGLPGAIALVGMALGGLAMLASTVGTTIVGALSPILLPIAAIGAAVAGLWYIWNQNFGNIQGVLKNTASIIKGTFTRNRATFREMERTIRGFMKQFDVALSAVRSVLKFVIENYTIPLIKRLRKIWVRHFSDIAKETNKTLKFILGVVRDVGGLINTVWKQYGDEIMTIAKMVFGFLELFIGTTFDAILTIIKVGLALIRGDFDSAFTYVKNFVTRTLNNVVSFLEGDFLKGLKAGLKLVKMAFSDIFSAIKDAVVDAMYNLANTGLGYLQTFGEGVEDVLDSAIGKIENVIETIEELTNVDIDIDIPSADDIVPDIPKLEKPDDDDSGGSSGGSRRRAPPVSGGFIPGVPQLASGGLVDSATLAYIGEAGTEAVVPLDKLTSYLNTAFAAGIATTTPTARTAPASSSSTKQQITARLRVEGDDELARLIRDNAEIVVDEREQSKRDRINRL